MKKILLTTTLLVATAGMAAAEVTLSGSGRFGLTYDDSVGEGSKETQLSYRLRFNIDASKETDSGVTFGGRIRLQYDNGDVAVDEAGFSTGAGAELSAAYVYAKASGFTVELGNANGAFDTLGTLYNSELGFIGTTQGSYNISNGYSSFSSGPFSGDEANRVGIFAQYEIEGFVARASYHTPDQTVEDLGVGVSEEYSVSLDYTTGQFKIGAGYVANGNFVDGNNTYALLGEYAINDTTNVGLQYINTDSDSGVDNSGVTVYGNTVYNQIGLGAFVSSTDDDTAENDIAFGIGASYDLGGATLAGTIQQTFSDDTYADLGVSFSF